MANNVNKFIIRVYGILTNDAAQILLSDEYALDTRMTKFPGGGLEFGEGPEDCLRREAMEEFGQEIEILEHFYTTGFFQKAMFFEDHQLISIYYRMQLKRPPLFRISDTPFDFTGEHSSQSFRWVSIREFNAGDLTFPIDRFVLNLLKKHYDSY